MSNGTTTAPAAPTPGQMASAALHQWLSTLGMDALLGLTAPLTAFGTSIQQTPTEANLIAQSLLVVPQGLAMLPTVESAAIGATGKAILGLVSAAQAWAAAKAAAIVAPAAPTPPPPAAAQPAAVAPAAAAA
jgi:hypothetical protein